MNHRYVGILAAIMIAVTSIAIEAKDLAQADDFKQIDETLHKIQSVADGYPPHISNDNEREQILIKWRKIESILKISFSVNQDNYDIAVRLGDCYRYGHNLDVAGAYDNAIMYLKRAILLKPSIWLPHFLLGKHYTYSTLEVVPDGEKELVLALKLVDKGDIKQFIYRDLAHAYYFQRKYVDAKKTADVYLLANPDDRTVMIIRDRSEQALRGEFEPKIIELK